MLPIVTHSLLLRDFQITDLQAYREIRRNEKCQAFYSEAESTDEKTNYLLQMFIAQSAERPRQKFQLAIVLASGELIGSCGIRIEIPGHASIGCELGQQWHSRGFAQEACRAIIQLGFEQLKLRRIYAETISENTAAVTLCQRLGMTIESERSGDQFFRGRNWTTSVLAITDNQWRENNTGLQRDSTSLDQTTLEYSK